MKRSPLAIGLRASSAAVFIHFAGLKSVGDSLQKPLVYFDINVAGNLRLLQDINQCDWIKMVFRSSAKVYGNPQLLALTEEPAHSTTNPYRQTKLVIENMPRDFYPIDKTWRWPSQNPLSFSGP